MLLGRLAHERKMVALIGAVQFVNILDFVMVMPMGPDFAAALHIDMAQLGAIGGAYTLAAAVSGLVCALFLDRFDRRPALALSLFGLALGTAAGGFAWDLSSLMAARVLAGAFGGPATALAMSLIADVVPVQRRGRAMGAVMGAFSVASIIGIPAGLELARLGGWRLPFFAVAGLGVVINACALWVLPSMRSHVAAATAKPIRLYDAVEMFARREFWLCYAMAVSGMMSAFLLIPNLSAYCQYNLGMARDHLGSLYFWGGAFSFFSMRLAGRAVDKLGALGITIAATLIFGGVLWTGFWHWTGALPVIAVFVPYFIANSMRNVAFNATISKVPKPYERARFMSAMSAVQHLSAAAGAFLSSKLLTELPNHTLDGMAGLATVAFVIGVTLPLWLGLVERQVRRVAQLAVAA